MKVERSDFFHSATTVFPLPVASGVVALIRAGVYSSVCVRAHSCACVYLNEREYVLHVQSAWPCRCWREGRDRPWRCPVRVKKTLKSLPN